VLLVNARLILCLRMLGEFEDAKDAKDANDDERSAALGGLAVAAAVGLLDGEHDEVRDDRQHVEGVHNVEAELALGRTGDQTHDELDAEPGHARRLHHVERILYVHRPAPDSLTFLMSRTEYS